MSVKTIKLKRGLEVDLPVLNQGEPAFTIDTQKLYIGTGTEAGGNVLINSDPLTNMLVVSPEENQVLVYIGTNWVNATVPIASVIIDGGSPSTKYMVNLDGGIPTSAYILNVDGGLI